MTEQKEKQDGLDALVTTLKSKLEKIPCEQWDVKYEREHNPSNISTIISTVINGVEVKIRKSAYSWNVHTGSPTYGYYVTVVDGSSKYEISEKKADFSVGIYNKVMEQYPEVQAAKQEKEEQKKRKTLEVKIAETQKRLESPTVEPKKGESLNESINRQVSHSQEMKSKFYQCLRNAQNSTGKENAYWISEAQKYNK